MPKPAPRRVKNPRFGQPAAGGGGLFAAAGGFGVNPPVPNPNPVPVFGAGAGPNDDLPAFGVAGNDDNLS